MATKHFLGGRIILGTEFAGYKWAFFEPGTSTPKTTYKDSRLTVGNENLATVVADANGAAQIWFDGNADVVFYTPAGVSVYSDDDINLTETSSATGEANLALNPSFEDDTDADGVPNSWTPSLFTGGTFSLDSTDQFNGSKSAKFVSTGTGGATLTSANQFAVSPSTIYTLGFAIKSTADVRNIVQIFWYQDDGTASATVSVTVYDDSTTNPTSWTEKWVEVTSPSDAAFAAIKITGCSSTDPTAGTARFDDIKFTRYALKNAPYVFPHSVCFETAAGASAVSAKYVAFTTMLLKTATIAVTVAGTLTAAGNSQYTFSKVNGTTTTSVGFSGNLGTTAAFTLGTNVVLAGGTTTLTQGEMVVAKSGTDATLRASITYNFLV